MTSQDRVAGAAPRLLAKFLVGQDVDVAGGYSLSPDVPDIWKVGICYTTYILCYVPPLLRKKTMQQHI